MNDGILFNNYQVICINQSNNTIKLDDCYFLFSLKKLDIKKTIIYDDAGKTSIKMIIIGVSFLLVAIVTIIWTCKCMMNGKSIENSKTTNWI